MNYLQLVKYGGGLLLDAYRQKRFIAKFLHPLVYNHAEKLGYGLSKSEKKKILFYYPMYTVLACAQMYITLKGRELSTDETKRLTLVGAMATICDDLIDEDNWSRDQIFYLLNDNIDETNLNKRAQLLLALNRDFLSLVPSNEKYLIQLKKALEWQAVSENQTKADIKLEEIANVCREKNGNTSLMFASLLDEDWSEQDKQFIYQSAIVGQLTNDSFDIYFDTKNGINTYVNRASSIKDVRKFFIDECTKLHRDVMACDAPLNLKKKTIRRMSCMHGFTLVALKHLQETEDKYGLQMDWKKPSRKEMVTDLEWMKNKLRLPVAIKDLSKLKAP